MDTEQIAIIVKHVQHLLSHKLITGSQLSVKAGVSTSYITAIKNNDYDKVSDATWRKLASKLGLKVEWNIAQTQNLKCFTDTIKWAKNNSESVAISDDAGCGKTTAFKYCSQTMDNVFLIECKNYWSKRDLVKNQLLALNVKVELSKTTSELIVEFVERLRKMHRPVVIYDQFEKLKEVQKDLFMDYYNDLDGTCAFVLSGVRALQKTELRGCRLDKVGYKERYSRYGSRFIIGKSITFEDVMNVCQQNGLTEDAIPKVLESIEPKKRMSAYQCLINEITGDSKGDFRRVKRSVLKYLLMEDELMKK